MPVASRQVAVVEEDETLREAIGRAIRLEQHRVSAFGNGEAARDVLSRSRPDAAVVSLSVPGLDGAELCRQLRERAEGMPLVALAPDDDAVEAWAAAASAPANDYLAKPFTIKDLMPRLMALIRRAGLTGHEPLSLEDRPLTLGALIVDPLRLRGSWHGTDLRLTVTEFFVLLALVRRTGNVKTRDQLLQETFPGRTSASDGVIDRVVSRLRRRFETVEPGLDVIEGVHGAGFRYRAARRP